MSMTLENEARERLRVAFSKKAEAEQALAENETQKGELHDRIEAARQRITSFGASLWSAPEAEKPQITQTIKQEREALPLMEAKFRALVLPRALQDRLSNAEQELKLAARAVVLAQPDLQTLFEEHRRLREQVWKIEATLHSVTQSCVNTPPGFHGWDSFPSRQHNGARADPKWAAFLSELIRHPDAVLLDETLEAAA